MKKNWIIGLIILFSFILIVSAGELLINNDRSLTIVDVKEIYDKSNSFVETNKILVNNVTDKFGGRIETYIVTKCSCYNESLIVSIPVKSS